jgi:hypothetical protein
LKAYVVDGDVKQKIAAVVERIASGHHAGAAEQFVETVALGPACGLTCRLTLANSY